MVYGNSKDVVAVEKSSTAEEPGVLCIVKDETNVDWQSSRITVNLPASTQIKKLYNHVAKEFGYEAKSFLLVWLDVKSEPGAGEIQLNDEEETTLAQFGLQVGNARNNFLVKDKDGIAPIKVKETTDEVIEGSVSAMFNENTSLSSTASYTGSYYAGENTYGKSNTGFVGLVNQAMTCYLNSLLQTLYMTPEFRNAIYKWEATGEEEKDIKCIPSQLQKLFLKLQTSTKRAVETTDLTRSFGWDSSEAWQQHDVQELCRVMFDALEGKFKGTEQEDLINKLYQGKLKDYVKCLECGHESARTDSYLDVPLTIRPFGENKAFGSVMESLEAFAAPETLDGSNQYFCEKCNKKCDAHKGLKFLTFPYLLTIQLKRFAFDYVTLHRIKLNDRMTFAKFLDLNKFASADREMNSDADELESKGDSPCGTETDSGVSEGYSDGVSIDDDDVGSNIDNEQPSVRASNDAAQHLPNAKECFNGSGEESEKNTIKGGPCRTEDDHSLDDDDAGLPSTSTENGEPPESNKEEAYYTNFAEAKGPYVYELFSIMIHSGSASGGHYYAYIKSFADNQWYCFNDQNVTQVGDDEIERTFGGSEYGPRGYYSSLYSSSTNAYMLMYRQVLPSRNSKFLSMSEVPSHIKRHMKRMQEQEEAERRRREEDRCTCKIKVFFYNPVLRKVLERKLEVHMDKTLTEATDMARELFGVELVYPANQCRLVKYDEYYDSIEKSYDGDENTSMGELLGGVKSSYMFELLLETRQPNESFLPYKPGGTTIKVHKVDLVTGEVSPALTVRGCPDETINDIKQILQEKLHQPAEHMRLVTEVGQRELKLLEMPDKALKDLGFFKAAKMFVECSGSEDKQLPFTESQLYKVLDSYQHTIRLLVTLPNPTSKPTDTQTSRYIFEEPKESPTSKHKEVELLIDKRETLAGLKKKLEPLVECPSELFRIYRVYCNNQEIENTRLQDTLSAFMDDTKVLVKYGRALRKGECQIKVFMLSCEDPEEPFRYVFDWIVHKGMSVRECKELLHPELQQRYGFNCPVDHLRLRKKTWKNPSTIFLDTQVFDEDIAIYANFEVFVEKLPGPEPMSTTLQRSVYVCHWQPSILKLGPLHELVLSDSSVSELKTEICKLSNIPVDCIDFAKGRGPYPCCIPVLEVQEGLEWNPDVESLGNTPLYICDDGAVIFYRDKTESVMELSEEKKKELSKKDSTKSSTTPMKPSYSYKERALKIYTDGTKPKSL